ncbi:MAG: glycosyltransferase family 2 protein [Lachnospiraceae bacterium]|nr:glycosyltransferase family 2 protein [Lachnospiraceae bacterium]
MKLLTIVIPAYNVEKYLNDAISPYLKLNFVKYLEVLIVNDGSKDRTLQLAKEYEKKYPDFIKVIDKQNGGHGSAINAGIERATGKYFKVVDGDDWVDANVLDKLLGSLETTESDMIATGFVIIYEDIKQKEEVHICNVEYGKEYQFSDICGRIDYIRMHSTIFRTKILQDNHIRLDEHCFYVDVEHDLFPLKWIKTVVFFDDLLYQYRIGRPGQSVNIKSMIKNRENHDRVIKRIIDLIRDDTLPKSVKDYMEKKLENMINIQYSILFAMKAGKKERQELMEYDEWLKKNNRELYNSITQKKILLMRKMKFWNYYFVKLLYKLSGKRIDYIK